MRNWLQYARDNLCNKEENVLIRQVMSSIDIFKELSKKLEVRFNDDNYAAVTRCPYHKEFTGSLYINKKYGTFYCFGCEESGKLFDLWLFVDPLSACNAVRNTEHANTLMNDIDKNIEPPKIWNKEISQEDWDAGIKYLIDNNLLNGLKRALIVNSQFISGYKGYIEIEIDKNHTPLANNYALSSLCDLFMMIGGYFPFEIKVTSEGKVIGVGSSMMSEQ